MRIFLDANILFSAAKSDGAIRRLVNDLTAAGHTGVADGYVIAEARHNLQRKGPDALAFLDEILARLEVRPAQARATNPGATEWLPDKDRPVLDAAIAAHCDALVTGDRSHFGSAYGKTFGGVAIHSPRTLAEAL